MELISVKDRLPEVDEFGESDYLLCIEEDIDAPVVCWYSSTLGWIVAHYKSNSTPINVTHYMPLPSPFTTPIN